MVNRRKDLETAVTLISLAFHLLGFFQLYHQWRALSYPGEWFWNSVALLSASFALNLLILFTRRRRVFLAALATRAIIFFLISLSVGDVIGIRFLLLGGLSMDFCARESPAYSLSGTLLLLVLSVFSQRPMRAFGVNLAPPPVVDIVLTLAVAAVLAVAVAVLRWLFERIDKERQTNASLLSEVLQLSSANAEYLRYASMVEQEAAANERNRITRDLHDIVGQTLTNIIMMMDAALHASEFSADELERLHQWTRDYAQNGLVDIRAALYALRSVSQEKLRGIQAIKKFLDTFEKLTHVEVTVEWGNLPWEMPEAIEQVVLRIIQESLSNSYRHGHATKLRLHFLVSAAELQMTIADNGRGGDDSSKGLGQSGMEERIRNLGGEIAFRSGATGYAVMARIPMGGEDAVAATG